MDARLFSGTVHLRNRRIVRDSVRTLAYDIPKRNLSRLLSHYRKLIVRYFVNWAPALYYSYAWFALLAKLVSATGVCTV